MFVFYSDYNFHFGKTMERKEDQDDSVKICIGWEVMSSHRISG